jgi:hypothetical protein
MPGYEARDRLDSRLLEMATSLGRRAAERFNETRPTEPEQQLADSERRAGSTGDGDQGSRLPADAAPSSHALP